MALSPGTRLGPYEIVAPLGAGGMGEVYRACDTKLGREVAIKILPEHLASDRERLARFEREARLLASLNHPHIATLHGLEESSGQKFLVMELVEGETLAERIASGPMPIDEVAPLFRHIAEGLEAAHEKGVIHRDLKPANIKLTPEGKPKILDFGLAKAYADEASGANLSESPTVTKGTATGVILGTASYMSPEQAKGKPVDKRTDIWAFGCCLYEALTGRHAFGGESVSEVLANILKEEPNWASLPTGTPSTVVKLLRRCLTKEPRDRLRDIGEARFGLDEKAATSPTTEPTMRRYVWALGGLLLGLLIAGVLDWSQSASAPTEFTKRFTLKLSPDEPMGEDKWLTLSPDGTALVYVANIDGRSQLVLRRFDQLEGARIRGTEDALFPFFSPDGQWIGFLTNPLTQGTALRGELKKVPVSGGLPVTLATWAGNPSNWGAAWGDDDWIVFPSASDLGLSRISADGGTPQMLVPADDHPDFKGHGTPEVLPGSKAILFVETEVGLRARIVVRSLETGEQTVLKEDANTLARPRYVPTRHLVYREARDDLVAAPFDMDQLAVTGPAVPVLEKPYPRRTAFSQEGTLVYQRAARHRSLVWVNRRGEEQPLPGPEYPFYLVRISPDGSKAALDQDFSGLWLYDLARQSMTRLNTDPEPGWAPVWSPDGLRIAFQNPRGFYWTSADGSGPVERLSASSANPRYPFSWSPDGKYLIVEESTLNGSDIRMLSLDEPRDFHDVIDAANDQTVPALSFDGRWLAYESNESGRIEIYVTSFPEVGRKWQISTEGGISPLWGPDGTELFYRNGRDVMRVPLETSPRFARGKPELLFSGDYYSYPMRAYDISPDGERFLMIKPDPTETTELEVVLNWFAELKRLVPTAN